MASLLLLLMMMMIIMVVMVVSCHRRSMQRVPQKKRSHFHFCDNFSKCWTFKFNKVVWQQIWGEVAAFDYAPIAVYCWMQNRKNCRSRTTFAKVVVKVKLAYFCCGTWCADICKRLVAEWLSVSACPLRSGCSIEFGLTLSSVFPLARDAQAKHALIIAKRLFVHPSVLLCVRNSFCSVANMVSTYSVYFLLITFYSRLSATINLYLDSSSVLPLSR